MNTEAPLADLDDPPKLDLTDVRVLLVEDDVDSRDLMALVLQDCRAVVSVAGSGEEALRRVAVGDLDVIVSDIGLPDMDGYALIRRIRAAQGAATWIPAIALTGHAGILEAQRALAAGFQVHVAKPMDSWLLADAVANVFGMSRPATSDGSNAW